MNNLLISGYPISLFYKFCVEPNISHKVLKHLYFSILGCLLYLFNYGLDIYHSAIAILLTYIFCVSLPRNLLVKVNFGFHMSYLLIGYYLTESNEYDILWTMPHCVLVLRLIGFGFDVADGKLADSDLSKEQKENCIRQVPDLLQLAAYSYFPSSFIAGPQFPFQRYRRFINNEFANYKSYLKAGILRGSVGLLYLIIRQIGAIYLPDDYFLSTEYNNTPFFTQVVQMGLWGKISLYKYISCWLLAEGSLTLMGM